MYYTKEDNKIICRLCLRNCVFSRDGDLGYCRARVRKDGKLLETRLNEVSAIAVDPIEKKPLFHYKPGSSILSIGRNFCNLACEFCQNSSISQSDCQMKLIDYNDIKSMLGSLDLVAFTYDEPLMSYEFLCRNLERLNNDNIGRVVVTNGILNNIEFKKISNMVDAYNIDVKSYESEFYNSVAHIDGDVLTNVLDNVNIAKKSAHVELSYLLIPELNDNRDKFKNFIKGIVDRYGEDQVLHINRYFPSYKLKNPITPLALMIEFYEIARSYLNFVYLGNISDDKYSSTYCPNCGELLISRSGYEVKKYLKKKLCPVCSSEIDIAL